MCEYDPKINNEGETFFLCIYFWKTKRLLNCRACAPCRTQTAAYNFNRAACFLLYFFYWETGVFLYMCSNVYNKNVHAFVYPTCLPCPIQWIALYILCVSICNCCHFLHSIISQYRSDRHCVWMGLFLNCNGANWYINACLKKFTHTRRTHCFQNTNNNLFATT